MEVAKTLRLVFMFSAVVAGTQGRAVAQRLDRNEARIKATVTNSIVAARAPEPNKLSALSLFTGKWETYTAPPGTELEAVVLGNTLALSQKGPHVKELAVFDGRSGTWTTQTLPAPAKGGVSPRIFKGAVVFTSGKFVYAYREADRR